MSKAQLSSLSVQLAEYLAPDLNTTQCAEYILRQVKADTKGGTRKDWTEVSNALNGLARTARIRVQDDLAEGIEKALGLLATSKTRGGGWEGDMPIKMSNLPEHIQLLLNLSSRPTSTTHDFASAYLSRPVAGDPSPDEIIYAQIMSEPFTGSHWGKSYDEEVKEGWTDSDDEDGSPPSADDDERLITPSAERVDRREIERREATRKVEEADERHRTAIEQLRNLNRYWVNGGKDIQPIQDGIYGWNDLCSRAQPASLAAKIHQLPSEKVISAEQLQRELLFLLSGRPSLFLIDNKPEGLQISSSRPQIRHFSPRALDGILQNICQHADHAARIRAFVNRILMPTGPSTTKMSKTRAAFAEACRTIISDLDTWISGLEAAFTIGYTDQISIATPLALQIELETRYKTLLEDIISFISLSEQPTLLLNALYSHINAPSPNRTVFTLFVETARPIWAMLSDWLQRGMPIPSSFTSSEDYSLNLDEDERQLDQDFFIKRDRDVSWTDEDFWECAYVENEGGWPIWMGDTLDMIIEAGKARGLIRTLMGSVGDIEPWNSLDALVSLNKEGSTVDIPQKIRKSLEPRCLIVTFQLRRVLEEDCGLAEHLTAVEGVMYMREHEVMNEWMTWLHGQVQAKKKWNDMQSLTSSLRDVIDHTQSYHLNPSAIRMTVRKTRGAEVMEVLSGIRPIYTMPFPLSVLFTPSTLELRAQVFAFLVRIGYGRKILANTTVDSNHQASKAMWMLRQRLIWFTNTLWTWAREMVVEVSARRYKDQLGQMTSLKAMINLELAHARAVRNQCFLHEQTREVHQRISTILEFVISLDELTRGGKSIFSRMTAPKRRKDAESSDEDLSDADENCDGDNDDSSNPPRNIINVAAQLGAMSEGLLSDVAEIKRALIELTSVGTLGDEDGTRIAWSSLSLMLEDWK